MYILGVSCYYHDASAALLKDGVIVAAAEEERFTRKKHDTSFPENAIRYCLGSQGITAKDLQYVAFYEKPFLKFERMLFQHLETFPRSYKTFVATLSSWINEKLRVPATLRNKIGYRGRVLFVEHHLAHAASTFLVSPFRKAAIVTADGVGEWTTTAFGIGDGSDITLLKEIRFPHSIGLLYSTITAYLGFQVNDAEYKVMGLAAYGDMNMETNEYYKLLRSVVDLKEDGSYRLDMDYFTYHFADRMPSKKLCGLLGGPVRREEELTQRHKDIAAAVQLVTEEVLTAILKHAYSVTGCENLVLSGGVALNSVFNGKILQRTPFRRLWIQPAASDGGTSLGAASYIYHTLLGHPRNHIQRHAYLGPEFSEDYLRTFLVQNHIRYSEFPNEKKLIDHVARMLLDSQVVGWFQGRMEWGPRALGARSILANPCNPDMRDILNTKVKHREEFRPFAPVVCVEDVSKYFECDLPLPEPTDFMLMVYPVKEKWRKRLPSVTHVDGSGRLQTLGREQNPRYHNLIKAFGKLSGVPILINTSFNIQGEPIVCSPEDAYRCMMGTGIDSLIAGRLLIRREDNPRDVWDSETPASDGRPIGWQTI